MKIRLITILIVVLTLLLAVLIPATIVLAGNDKPPVPHHNKDDKTVPANCHSQHARDVGMECGTNDANNDTPASSTGTTSNSSRQRLPRSKTEPGTEAVTYFPMPVLNPQFGAGGGHWVHVMY